MTVAPPASDLGELLQEFVNRVSHLQGKTLAVLTEQSVTLQQVLLLRRLHQIGESTPSDLGERMRMSLPAVSQMIERLVLLGLMARTESPDDRRKKNLSVTPKGQALLQRIRRARAAEYSAGTAMLTPALRAELLKLLSTAIGRDVVENSARSDRDRSDTRPRHSSIHVPLDKWSH